MSTLERQAHWQNVYQTKDEQTVSWFQERPDISLDLIHATGVDTGAPIIDIGGGASRLVDALLLAKDLTQSPFSIFRRRLWRLRRPDLGLRARRYNGSWLTLHAGSHPKRTMYGTTARPCIFSPIQRTVLHTSSAC